MCHKWNLSSPSEVAPEAAAKPASMSINAALLQPHWSVFLSQKASNQHMKAQLESDKQIAWHGPSSVSLRAIFNHCKLFLRD